MSKGKKEKFEGEKKMAGHHRVVKVKRETLESCMTCPLCNKLLKEATTISLCLHTFCRKCIYEKLSDEGMDCCPVCDIELGCLPVDKLRPDHNLQDVRAKIFPYKRRKISAPEVMPAASPPVKRKERSLSSLVVNTPKVPMQRGLTGRRTKATTRKRIAAFRGCSFSVEESLKKEDSAEDHPSGSSSPDSFHKISQSKRQDSMAQPSSEHRPNEDTDDVEVMEGKADLWTPLNCLVEAANRKSSKLNSQGSTASMTEQHNGPDSCSHAPEAKPSPQSPTVPDGKLSIHKSKSKEHRNNSVILEEENGTNLIKRPVKRRRLHAGWNGGTSGGADQGGGQSSSWSQSGGWNKEGGNQGWNGGASGGGGRSWNQSGADQGGQSSSWSQAGGWSKEGGNGGTSGGGAKTWIQSSADQGGQSSSWSQSGGWNKGSSSTNEGGGSQDNNRKSSNSSDGDKWSSWNQSSGSKEVNGSNNQGNGWGKSSTTTAGGWANQGSGSGDQSQSKTADEAPSSGWNKLKDGGENSGNQDPWGKASSTSTWGQGSGGSKGGW